MKEETITMTASDDFIKELRTSVHCDVLDDSYSMGMYSTDASFYQIMPRAVILPKSEEDVRIAVSVARKHKVSILPRGAGTSLAGQTVGKAMVIDFSRYMNQVLEVNAKERWVRVQPGVVRDDLNALLAKDKLHFAPDPATSSRANVGGMVGNNSSGTKSILYGKTVDHVLEARVLLADGTELVLGKKSPEAYTRKSQQQDREGEIYSAFQKVISENKDEIELRFPKVMRRVGGYNLDEFTHTDQWNLAKLITGSEGTLAVTLELKLNLEPLPAFKSVVVVQYASLLESIRSVQYILKYNPSAVELLDDTVLKMSRENLTTRQYYYFIDKEPQAILIVEFYGDSQEEVLRRPKEMIAELKSKGLGYTYPLFPEGKEYEDVWNLRKKGFGLMLGVHGDRKPMSFIEDAAVPIEHLPEYIEQVLDVCKRNETPVALYAHASVGLIHVQPLLDLRNEADIERLKRITEQTFELVVKYRGSWSGEHGDGLVRSAYNERFFGTKLYNAFREVKRIFDPDNLMNPGKIIEAQVIDKNLRYGTEYHDKPVHAEFKYRSENSFQESVHMCTGVGECRKTLGGTMCPSFKATRDEEHSTRGRANALRLAMSGQLNEGGLSSQRLHEVMDLCLSCKACKSECPSNVDMAKMKGDVLQMYYDKNGSKLRDRMVRDSSKMASMFSGFWAPLINFLQRTYLFRWTLQRIAGIDSRRSLPAYSSEPFTGWFAREGKKNQSGSRKKVALFADTFIKYHEPHIGIAATELLSSCGYEVVLADAGCCQRTKISHGFLRDAKRDGAKTISNLLAFIREGIPVVVCEPSCASALNDDLPDLIDDEEAARLLKDNVTTIDVFLDRERKNGNLSVPIESSAGNLLIHGHCHQKALYGTTSMTSLISGSQTVKEIPSGCCGMAGSFGYECEHYDLSEKIGDSILFPAVRNMPSGTTLVANGFSCRHQIEHFTHVKPKHWVEVVAVKKPQ